MPLITLNPQPGHTPCSLNFRVILIFRQLPSAYSIVSALLHPQLGYGALLPLSFHSFLVSASFLPRGPGTQTHLRTAGISCLRTVEGVDDHVEYRQYISSDLYSANV